MTRPSQPTLPAPRSAVAGPSTTPPLPWWLPTIVTVGALLTAAGGVIALVHPALLLSPGEQMNQVARVYAHYFASRNLALAIMLLGLLAMRARRVLGSLMVLTALIQLLDVVLDAATGRWALVPGLLVFTAAFLAGAARLRGEAFWRAGAITVPKGRLWR